MRLPYWQCIDCSSIFVPISSQDEFYFNCPKCNSSNTAPYIDRIDEEKAENEFFELINNFKEYYESDPEAIKKVIKPIIQRTGIRTDKETILSYYMGLAHGYIQKQMEISKFSESEVEDIGTDALILLTDAIVELLEIY